MKPPANAVLRVLLAVGTLTLLTVAWPGLIPSVAASYDITGSTYFAPGPICAHSTPILVDEDGTLHTFITSEASTTSAFATWSYYRTTLGDPFSAQQITARDTTNIPVTGDLLSQTNNACQPGPNLRAHGSGGPMNLVRLDNGDLAYLANSGSSAPAYFSSPDEGQTWIQNNFPAGAICATTISSQGYWARHDDNNFAILTGCNVSGSNKAFIRYTTDGGTTWAAAAVAVDDATIDIDNFGEAHNGGVVIPYGTEDYIIHLGGCYVFLYDVSAGTVLQPGVAPSNRHQVSGQSEGCHDITGGAGELDLGSRFLQTDDGTLWHHNIGDGNSANQDSYLWKSTNGGTTWSFVRLSTDGYTGMVTWLFTDGTDVYPVFHTGVAGHINVGKFTTSLPFNIDAFSGYDDVTASIGGGAQDFVCCDEQDFTMSGTVEPETGKIILIGTDNVGSEASGNNFIKVIEDTVLGGGSQSSTFCADPSSDDVQPDGLYGYDYVEGVVYDPNISGSEGLNSIDLDDGFVFEGDDDNSEYLGYGWTTGSRSFKSIARIEAAVEGSESLFRISYTPGLSGPPAADNKGSGGGETDEDFSQQVQAQWKETGNDWSISIYQVLANTRSKIGSSVLYGNPNQPTTFNFTIDTQEGVRYAVVRDNNGVDIINRTLSSALAGTFWKNVWYIGKGDSLNLNAFTILDDVGGEEDQNDDSTCIFDLTGNAELGLGGAGLAPPSTVPDDPTDTGEDEGGLAGGSLGDFPVPTGWTAAALNGFLGVILMFSIAAGAWFVFDKHIIALVIGAVAGFLVAMFFGLFELWVLIVVVILSVAAIFIGVLSRVRGGGASG